MHGLWIIAGAMAGGIGGFLGGATLGAPTVAGAIPLAIGGAIAGVIAGAYIGHIIGESAASSLDGASGGGPPRHHNSSEEPTAKEIGKGPNFKEHCIKKQPLLEDVLNKDYPSWSEGQGDEFLKDLNQLVKDGDLKFVGEGTLNKTDVAGAVYRGRGLTLKLDANGNFQTLLKSGEGMDLKIIIK